MQRLIIILIMAVNLYGTQMIEVSLKQQEDLGIKTQSVTIMDEISFGPYSGVVVLDKKDVLSISSNIESIVKSIHVRELEYVQKGQKLITIQSNALLSLQQNYIEAILENESANQNYERNLKLQADGIISNKKLLESEKNKRASDLKVSFISSQLLTNGFTSAMLQRIQKSNRPITEITIYAGRSGLINSVNVNIGEYVLSEHKMIEIYADGKRFIEMTIPVKDVQNISLGDVVSFSSFSAKVSAIGNVVNTKSQSVLIKATIEDAKKIMINRVYEVEIAKKVSGIYKIKKTALVFNENQPIVFRKISNGFEVLSVKIIKEGPVCYIIEADLKDSDEVAASSTSALLGAVDSEDE